MKIPKYSSIAFLAALAVVAAWFIPREKNSAEPAVEPAAEFADSTYATPPGVTLQFVGKAAGYSLDKQSAANLPRDEIVFADPTGLTLYTYDRDPPGESACYGECTETFAPLLASSGASPYGDWTLVARDDGPSQWALRGKPVYTYALDIDPGSVAGNSPAVTGAPRVNRAGNQVGAGLRGYSGEKPERKHLPEGWQTAYLYPMPKLQMPPGIAVKEVPDVSAFVLVDIRHHTLYQHDSQAIAADTSCADESCVETWHPLAAPLVAHASGDFRIVDRDDGIRQWTYRGRGLYTFSGDLAAGYANGGRRGLGWEVAAVTRLFNPSGVTIENTLTRGAVLAANGGKTLYRRDGNIFQSGGGHNLRRGAPARPAVGRDIGTDPRCGEQCFETWSPFLADDEAQARGYWEPVLREDGRKQWTYQGYAMWFYAADRNPGDMLGHDQYDITVGHDPDELIDLDTPMAGAAALWWSIAVP